MTYISFYRNLDSHAASYILWNPSFMCDVLAIHLSIVITRTILKFRHETRKSCENAEKMRNPPLKAIESTSLMYKY